MHKKLFYLFSLLLLSLVSCQKEEQQNNHPSLSPGQLKVMSFNIRATTTESDAFNNWGMRAGGCRDMMIDQQPSLIGMQEVVATQWKYMMGTLSGYGYVGVTDKDINNSFMYRPDELELLSDGVFWLSDTPDISSKSWDGYVRYVHWAFMKVLSSGQEFLFMNTHLGLTAASRKSGMSLILRRMKSLNQDNLPVVLMADFNTPATDNVFENTRQIMSLTREIAPVTDQKNTYNAWGNEAKACVIDHIWITQGVQSLEYKTVDQWYDGHKYVSDHYPVYSIIEF